MAKTKQSAKDCGSTYPSVAALAQDLGLCERSLRDAIRRGEVPVIKLGRSFILPRTAIRRWLEEAGRPVAADLR